MKPILTALLLIAANVAAAQSAAPDTGYTGPGIAHTGLRYCPELAGTEHPFRAVCPSTLAEMENHRVTGLSVSGSLNPGDLDNRGTQTEERQD